MSNLGYIIAGWAIPLGAIALYATSLLRRGRSIAARVPVERRRWIDSND